jgi:hypothetical protein
VIDPDHLRQYVIRPTLKTIGLWSENAERLLLGTACKESDCGRWLKQLGGGPALGIYQMEPATHNDLWENFLMYRDVPLKNSGAERMVGDLYYASAMCRFAYRRVPEPIPDTLPGQAQYWKHWYNTYLGAGTEEEYIAAWRRFVPSDLTFV